MDPITMSLVGLGIGGVLGSSNLLGGLLTNSANAKEARRARKLAINLANTAHQREVKDLRKAGLNPILSAGGSGAATPTLATATYENPLKNVGSDISAGMDFADTLARVDLQEAQTAKLNAETAKIQAELPKSQVEGDVYKGLSDKGKSFFDALGDENTYKGMWNGIKGFFNSNPSSAKAGVSNGNNAPATASSSARQVSSDENSSRKEVNEDVRLPLDKRYDLSSARVHHPDFNPSTGKKFPFVHVTMKNRITGKMEDVYVDRKYFDEKIKPLIYEDTQKLIERINRK